MAKSFFICQNCGSKYSKWQGQCRECEMWNVIVEEIIESSSPLGNINKKKSTEYNTKIFDLSNSAVEDVVRRKIGVEEFDRVLGSGIVDGSAILLYGEPGIGKSTLLLQICDASSKSGF